MPQKFPTRSEIEASQLVRLRDLFSATRNNPFYKRKLSSLGKSIKFSSLEDFSAKVPFTTKQEIVADQLAKPPYGTNLTFPLSHYIRFHQTSGTTGTPIRWLDTDQSWQWMVESWKIIFQKAGVKCGDRVLFTFSFGPFIGFWLAYEAAQQLGCLCLPAGGLSSEARLRLLMDNEVTVLCCTPTYAIHLAEVAAKTKTALHLSKVTKLLVAGEPGGSIPATRSRLEKLWPNAQVFDHHGMTEVGPVTYQCPKQPGILHIIEFAYFAEIVNPSSGTKVQAGETGELILTTLGRFGSPLLRYRTGDLVKQMVPQLKTQNSKLKTSRGLCGTHELALEGGILGRVDDMIIVRGVNIFPSAVEDVLRRFADIAEYRVVVKADGALTELSVEMEPLPKCKAPFELAKQVENSLQTAFNLRISVTSVASGSLPRFEMKAKRWVRHDA